MQKQNVQIAGVNTETKAFIMGGMGVLAFIYFLMADVSKDDMVLSTLVYRFGCCIWMHYATISTGRWKSWGAILTFLFPAVTLIAFSLTKKKLYEFTNSVSDPPNVFTANKVPVEERRITAAQDTDIPKRESRKVNISISLPKFSFDRGRVSAALSSRFAFLVYILFAILVILYVKYRLDVAKDRHHWYMRTHLEEIQAE